MIKNKTLLSFLLLFSFTCTFVAPTDVSAAKDKSSNPYSKAKSKKAVKSKSKKKTYTYKTVQLKPEDKVPTATKPVRFKPGLLTSIPKIGADYASSLGYTGTDVYVAVIDTGIEKAHPFFQDRVALEACFATRCPNKTTTMIGPGAAAPVHYHGTHVAGIVGGFSNTRRGVAPNVKIIAINVFDPFGGAYDQDIVRALKWVHSIADQYNIAAINMSLGGSLIFKGTCDNYMPDMTQVIKDLKTKNIATVVASGNSYAHGMSAPACISDAVSVAATSVETDTVTDFSNVSQYTTLSAPGLNIVSSKLMGSYGAASGTSMSAPHVAGAFAVYRSKYGVQSVSKVVLDFQTYSSPAIDTFTKIVTKRIDFRKLFDSNQTTPIPTTTTIPTVSTTIPISTTTTTVPVTTTTVVEDQPYIGKPRLTSLYSYSTNWRSYAYDIFMVTYIDVNAGKPYLTHYLLTCNNGATYNIPVQSKGRLHSYRLKNADGTFASAVGIANCYLQGARNNQLGPQTWFLDVSR
jgi:subtilisin family serine protease